MSHNKSRNKLTIMKFKWPISYGNPEFSFQYKKFLPGWIKIIVGNARLNCTCWKLVLVWFFNLKENSSHFRLILHIRQLKISFFQFLSTFSTMFCLFFLLINFSMVFSIILNGHLIFVRITFISAISSSRLISSLHINKILLSSQSLVARA